MATAVCEKHGLRYDPERSDGCVVCRRERAGGGPAPAPATAPGDQGLPVALAATAGIWLIGGALLYAAHSQVTASIQQLRDGPAAAASAAPATEIDPLLEPGGVPVEIPPPPPPRRPRPVDAPGPEDGGVEDDAGETAAEGS